MTNGLVVKNICVTRDVQEFVHDVSFSIAPGELHILSGANGSGKSTLLNALMGHPAYTITAGTIAIDGQDVTSSPAFERARHGLFLSLQNPPEISGVSMKDFLRSALRARQGNAFQEDDFRRRLTEAAAQ